MYADYEDNFWYENQIQCFANEKNEQTQIQIRSEKNELIRAQTHDF